MKILIDIGHPAHVHYFRNFIKIMESKGHGFFIIAKNRNVTYNLLEHYKIPFVKRKDYPKSLIGKLLNIPLTDLLVAKHALKFKPDVMMGFSGTHVAHAGKLLNIPSIVIDDTDHATIAHASYQSFTSVILTPKSFQKSFGSKHIRFNGFMELCYLLPKYFKPDPAILEYLKIKNDERYVIVRFVSWNASHDKGASGISYNDKINIVRTLSEKIKVFISSDEKLPDEINHLRIKIPFDKMHDALAFSSGLFGESGTMTSECAVLGVPAIQISGLPEGTIGTLKEQQSYGLVKIFTKYTEGVLQQFITDISAQQKQTFQENKNKMLAEKIDVTAFMIWFVENFPSSYNQLRINPDIQNKFLDN